MFPIMKVSLLFGLLTVSLVKHTESLNLISWLKTTMGATISFTQFVVYGKRHFTRTGYEKHLSYYTDPVQSAATETTDGVSMEGRVVVVTGANSGIGKELATYAAAKGATLYMLCRSKGKAEAARIEIMEQTKSQKVNLLLADVGELAQVRNVVKELQQKEKKVDCLVCNAGVLLNERKETSEGNEVTFAAHFLGGSYLLSQLLLPQLKASDQSRVVFVSSGGMLPNKFPSWETATGTGPQKAKYNGNAAYSYAKRGQVLLAERLTKDEPEVTWVSAHPGWTSTPAVDDAYGENKKYLEPMRSTWEGAEGIAWMMQVDRTRLKGGEFYLDRKPQKKHIAGPFMTEGSYTKNTEEEVNEMMKNLKAAAGL